MGAKVAAQDIPCGMCLHSCVCVCVCVRSVMSDSATRWTVASRLQCLWNFAGKNAGVGCHFLLQSTDPGIKRVSPELAGKFFYL